MNKPSLDDHQMYLHVKTLSLLKASVKEFRQFRQREQWGWRSMLTANTTSQQLVSWRSGQRGKASASILKESKLEALKE